jgi:tetratricopeptide (TPR) repeat protein
MDRLPRSERGAVPRPNRGRIMSTVAVANEFEEHLARGIQFRLNGEYDDAATELQTALGLRPEHPVVHHELGLVYCFTGMFDESLQELGEAVRLDPQNLKFHENLGKTFTMLGMYEEAREQFELIIAQDPESIEADEARKQLKFFE